MSTEICLQQIRDDFGSVSQVHNVDQKVTQIETLLKNHVGYLNFSDEVWQSLATTMAHDKKSVAAAHIEQIAHLALTKKIKNRNSRKALSIVIACTDEVKAAMIREYSEYDLSFEVHGANHRPHPAAWVARKIDADILTRQIGYKERVVDIGGQYVDHVKRRHYDVHCCCPYLDAKDMARMVRRDNILHAWYRDRRDNPESKYKDNHLVGLFDQELKLKPDGKLDPGRAYSVRCFDKAQDCDFSASYGICLHSSYDIKLRELAAIMKKKNMFVCYGSMIHSEQVLYKSSGTIDALNAHFVTEKVDGVYRIKFSFIDDPSTVYDHNLLDYMDYLRHQDLVVDGQRYAYTVIDKRDTVLFFRMTRIPAHKKLAWMPLEQRVLLGVKPTVVINTFRLDWSRNPKKSDAYQPITLHIPKETYDLVYTNFLAHTKESGSAWTREQLCSYVRTIDAHFIVNGVSIVAARKMSPEDFQPFVTAMIVIAFKELDNVRRMTALTINGINEKRQLFDQTLWWIKAKFTQFVKVLGGLFIPNQENLLTLRDSLAALIRTDEKFITVFEHFDSVVMTGNVPLVAVPVAEEYGKRLEPEWYENPLIVPTQDEILGVDQIEINTPQLLEAFLVYASMNGAPLSEQSRQRIQAALARDMLKAENTHVDSDALLVSKHDENKKRVRDYALLRTGDEEDGAEEEVFIPYNLRSTFKNYDPSIAIKLCHSQFEQPDADVATVDGWLQFAACAIEEGSRYSMYQAQAAYEQAKTLYADLRAFGHDRTQFCRANNNEKTSPNILSFGPDGVLIGSLVTVAAGNSYMYGLNLNDELVQIRVRRENDCKVHYIETTDRELFVCEGLRIFNGATIGRALERCLDTVVPDDFEIPYIRADRGIAGCGKTTKLFKNWEPGEIILSACRDAADEVRERLVKAGKVSESDAKKHVRTIDSLLINPNVKSKVLYIDEVCMAHAGLVFAAIILTGAEVVYLFGDEKQIPFLDRTAGRVTLFMHAFSAFYDRTFANTTHRCPVDALIAASDFYDEEVFTTSEVLKSMNIVKIDSVTDVPVFPEARYMTYLRAERDSLRQRHCRASTVNEAQGTTLHGKVCLVRLEWQDYPIYKEASQILVALTRHTKELTYYTRDDTDMTATRIRAGLMGLANARARMKNKNSSEFSQFIPLLKTRALCLNS